MENNFNSGKNNFIYLFFLAVSAWAAFVFTACSQQAPSDGAQSPPGNCAVVSEFIRLQNQSLAFPASGRFVLESHLATESDEFADGRLFPLDIHEGIETHLNRSAKQLGLSQSLLYTTHWAREWTPPEGGLPGQGALGDTRPSVREEMFSGNMYWHPKARPFPGEKFLVTANGRSVVIAMGYEVGPNSKTFIGGLQPEVFHFLGADDETKIRIGRLIDQSLNYGAVNCEKK